MPNGGKRQDLTPALRHGDVHRVFLERSTHATSCRLHSTGTALVHLLYLLEQGLVGLRARTGRSALPVVVTTARNTQHLAHAFHLEVAFVCTYELVPHLDSRAKNATAFFKMSRSSFTRSSSRFNCASSSSGCDARPGP